MSDPYLTFEQYVALIGENKDRLYQFVNGSAEETVDTESGVIPTLAGISMAVSLRGGMAMYDDAATGLTFTGEGEYFRTPSVNKNEAEIIYRHDIGPTASEIARILSTGVLEGGYQAAKFVALFVDEAGNVPLWLEDGKLAASGVSLTLQDLFRENWAPNINQVARRVALFVDEAGNVPLWLENGLLGATGVTPELINSIFSRRPKGPTPLSTDGASLYRFKAKAARLRAGMAARIKAVFVGDSWTERPLIPQLFADKMYAEFGEGSTGWISAGSDRASTVIPINGVTFNAANWTLRDEVALATSLDLSALETTTTDSTITIGNLVAESVTIYSHDGDGAFRYRVDGGNWISIAGAGTETTIKTQIASLPDIPHTIDIDTVGNTGTVRLYGFYSQRSASGIEISKAGNGSSKASDWAPRASDSAAYLSDIDPDIVFVILGTNDSAAGVTKAAYKLGIESIVSAYHSTVPNAAIVLIAPPANGAAPASLLAEYAEALYEISETTEMVEFLNIEKMMASYSTMSDIGVWLNAKHMSEAGAEFIYDATRKYII